MAKINTGDIGNLNTSWENYSGASVERFIKNELKNRCGYIYRSQSKVGDFYYLYGFTDYDNFMDWQTGSSSVEPLFRVQLPNIENDVYSANISTNSNTTALINTGSGIKVGIKYTSISTNPSTGAISNTYNDGTLVIMRSVNGNAFVEVGRISSFKPVDYNSTTFTTVNLTPYLADGDNKIRIRVEDNTTGSVSSYITFNSIINTTLKITNATSTSKPLTAIQFSYYIQGNVSKTLHLKITGSTGTEYTYDYTLGASTYTEVPYTTPVINCGVGSGIITVDAYVSVNGTSLVSNTETNQFYFSGAGNTTSLVILNNVSTSVNNYTNVHFFDFSVYNKTSDVTVVVENGSTKYINYTFKNCTPGTTYNFYNVLDIDSQLDSITATVKVSSSDYSVTPYTITIDNSNKMNPTSGASFILNPNNRNNTETNPGTIKNEATGSNVTSTFTGFSFIDDGWTTDTDNIKVLRIPAGRTLNISYDPLSSITNGMTLEFDFKTYNDFDDTKRVFSFMSSNLGFEMYPTEAIYWTGENQVKRDQDIMFQEGERTHVAINIVPNLYNSGLNYIRLFINGIINREMEYKSSDVFKSGTVSLSLGSTGCDLDVYGIRCYRKKLSATDIRKDYMSSLPTIEKKLAFQVANNILDSNNNISYAACQGVYNTLVWSGNHPEYKTGKVKYYGDLKIEIVGDRSHSGTINNMCISGQGSSSRGYWKWNHQYDFNTSASKGAISKFTSLDGQTSSGYALTDDDPEALLLVSKLNWASSMQSHKMGSTALYTDLWKEIIGGNSITKTSGYSKVRVSVHEKPFLYFIQEPGSTEPVFQGLVTFGSGKKDIPTFIGSTTKFPNYLALEGSDNGMPLVLRHAPWIDDEVTYNEDEEYYEYADQGNWDFCLGNTDRIGYFKNAINFVYQNTLRLKPYTNSSELKDTSYQYWNTASGNVVRYDWISDSWVNAGMNRTQDCEYHYTTQEDVDSGKADKVGVKVVDQYPVYSVLNIKTQTGINPSGTDTEKNAAFIAKRKESFKTGISSYYNVNDVLYTMAFLKMVAASDNRCKNTYEYLDPGTYKICMFQDDLDTIFLTDNVGRKTKPYYVEEYDLNGASPYFNGSDNAFYYAMDICYESELKNMMKQILSKMRTKYGSVKDCLQEYYYSTQEYFPAVAYNEAARLLYEEASVAAATKKSDGSYLYTNSTPPISQSLGDQLQAEKQWFNRRIPYLQSWCSEDPFYVRSTSEASLMFRSIVKTDGSNPTYSFVLTPWQYLYPKTGIGQTMNVDNTRVEVGKEYNAVSFTTDGNTDTYIYGSGYYTSFGEFGGVPVGETFNLNGGHLLEFSADSRQVTKLEFRPSKVNVNCPALKKLCLYGVSTITGSMDLSGCTKLVTLDLRGTSVSSVILPQTGTLTNVYLPSSLTSLEIVNCPNIVLSIAGTSSLSKLTTDSNSVLKAVLPESDIPSSSTGIELHVSGVTWTGTTGSGSKKMLDSMLLSDTEISGNVTLAMSIGYTEKVALVKKYGNIDSVSNPLHITYTVVSSGTTSITVGATDVTGSNIYKGNTYSLEVSGYNKSSNDISGVTWTSTVGTLTVNSSDPLKATLSIPRSASGSSCEITVSITRTGSTGLSAEKSYTLKDYVEITGISLPTMVMASGNKTFTVTSLPSTYSAPFKSMYVEVTGSNVSFVSQDLTAHTFTLKVDTAATDTVIQVPVTVKATSIYNTEVSCTGTIYLHNPITEFRIGDTKIS